ncbi:dihydrodipicolinate synthase family protein [Litorilinea aerophila]|uniref:Dihydrodipicolinate synthase family protein n=1 Tax=Litorilinea aerophila TaxID=1204385 RepID=A0A540VK56_9CHLR|nr:dihydrodipicolinate synthase family protein [Litorilinea aerophila]MCC9075230.1 dihydrodipicolinate synthase family protein [Litorilinea aerophila]
MSQPWRGIFVIVVTPFTSGYELDEESLRKEVRYCIEAGAHGLVGPANASEFPTLSDDERRRWIEIVVAEAGGQIPVIAATTSGHWLPALELSRHAQRVGADGIMAMPPHVLHPDAEGCYAYYKALSDGLEIPIFVQNYIGPVGTPMSPQLLARMCRELKHVDYLKEETLPEPRQISATIAAAGDACKGVFGGQGGIYMLDEYRRGACGNMPASQATEVHVAIWEKLEQGDEAGARQLFNRLLPLINFERMHGVAAYKEVLYRRGIFATRLSRAPGKYLDDLDRVELDAILADVEPLFTIS